MSTTRNKAATGSPVPIQTPTTRTSGYVKIPAPPFEACPHCQEMNTDRIFRVWRVADERGLHFECDSCSHAWTVRSQA